MKIVYPDGRQPFNLADYMGKNRRSAENTNTNPQGQSQNQKNDVMTYYDSYKYYTGNFNKEGTTEFIPIMKERKVVEVEVRVEVEVKAKIETEVKVLHLQI